MKDLEVKREWLQSQMLQIESAICLEDYNSAKKFKREAPETIKQTQIKIDFFCKSNPAKICENIVHSIVQSAWKVIYPFAQSFIIEENNDVPKAIKVKAGYSQKRPPKIIRKTIQSIRHIYIVIEESQDQLYMTGLWS